MATLDLSAVQKTYPGGNTAVHHVDASIDDGEFIVIVGPSGCGKSTLLRMVAGLEGISNGEIRIDGARVNELEPARRDIAMVFQNYALYPHMSVFDNMAYALKLQNRPKDEIRRRVEEAAAILELDALLTRRPRQLSGGQRQRVAMGRAIVRQPRLFLFDEPLSNLDARLRVQMRLEIQRLHRRLRTTSLYVTHDQVEAMTLAQRMIVMNLGRVEQIGTPAEVYERPASTFVASFIGAPPMNLLPVRMSTDGDATTPDGMRIPAELLADTPTGWHGQDVLLGIRPEHLSLTDPHQGLALQVEMVEALGAEVLVYGRFGTHTLVLRLQGDQLGASRQSAPQAGAIISCRPNRQQGCWHAYAPDTGMRLPD